MKKPFLFILLLSITSTLLFAQANKKAIQDLKVDVVYLSADLLEGREIGTKGETLAAEYVASRFEELSLSPKADDNTFYQAFHFRELANPHATSGDGAREGMGKNVVGYLDNGAKNTIIIGAHFDHLGYGGSGSLYADGPAIHNGADDNASGVAALLLIAEQLKTTAKNNNYIFIAFSGEEKGLFGSKHFADNPTIDMSKVSYMLNMDMVGRLNEEKVLAVSGAGTSPVWKDALAKITVGGITTKTSDSGIGPSDHTSFYLKDLPVLHFFTGQHMDYHKPSDDAELINYEGLYDVSHFIIALIEALDQNGKLEFTKTKDNDDKKVSRFKVTLGVMPDYVYTGTGMRIDGVIEDRPAKKAGLEKGDVIIKIGDIKVKDIYDYMKGLAKYEKGDKVKVVVLRKDKEVTKKVTF